MDRKRQKLSPGKTKKKLKLPTPDTTSHQSNLNFNCNKEVVIQLERLSESVVAEMTAGWSALPPEKTKKKLKLSTPKTKLYPSNPHFICDKEVVVQRERLSDSFVAEMTAGGPALPLEQVSIGSAGTMADSCGTADLKETIEKMNADLIQSYTKISELNAEVRRQDAKIREQEEGLSAAQKEMSNLREDNTQLARDLKESEEKCKAVQERLELAEQKLALFSQKPDGTAEECLEQVDESNDNAYGINSLHDEIILQVFGYLMQNQLGQIARVCRRWNVLTKSPVLWKKVNVKFSPSHECQTTVAESLINGLPSCLTSIRLDFVKCDDWIKGLEFEELCPRLQEKCPHLEELILIHSVLPISPPSIIDLCTEFLQDVKNLIFHYSEFHCNYSTGECLGISKIEILDLFNCCFYCSSYQLPKLPFSKMTHLKQLHLYGTDVDDYLFEDDASFFNQLDVLNLGFTYISAETFQPIQNHGHNLKELYLCFLDLRDHDLTFTYSVFPYLKTICLYDNHVTCEGVVSLIQSCPSLENVYVDEDVAESFSAHAFVLANICKSGIVKATDPHKHCHMWT